MTTSSNDNKNFPFPSAKEEVSERLPEKYSPQYPLAFIDHEFLLSRDLRPIRLLLEFQKAEMKQQEYNIHSTIVIFGSSKIMPPEEVHSLHSEAEMALQQNPENENAKIKLAFAKQQLNKIYYYEEARKLAHIVSSNCQLNSQPKDFVIATGGGPGIMEAANRGAFEADKKSIGLSVFLPTEERPNPYITPELNFQFHYFALRKMHFLIRARALVFFPGGYGTLDELFEALTLMQTRKIKNIPILLIDQKYWSKIINFEALVEEGAIEPVDLKLFTYVNSAEEAWETIASFYNLDPKTCARSPENN